MTEQTPGTVKVTITVDGRAIEIPVPADDVRDMLARLVGAEQQPADVAEEPTAADEQGVVSPVEQPVGLTTDQAAQMCGLGPIAFRALAARQPTDLRLPSAADHVVRWDEDAVRALSVGAITTAAAAAAHMDYSLQAFESWADAQGDLRVPSEYLPDGWDPRRTLWDAHLVQVRTRPERPGLSTDEAADLAGVRPSSFRAWASRHPEDLRLPPERWADRRTPLWDEIRVKAALAARTGQGARTDLPDRQITLPGQAGFDSLLWHLAGPGLALICEHAGHRVQVGWDNGEQVIRGVSWDDAARAVANHAAEMHRAESWIHQTLPVAGKPVHVMSPFWPVPAEPADLVELLARRQVILDRPSTGPLSARMIAGIGRSPLPYLLWSGEDCILDLDPATLADIDQALADPATRDRSRQALNVQWSLDTVPASRVAPAGVGTSPWDMTPRQQGSNILRNRLGPLAETVSNCGIAEIIAALKDRQVTTRPAGKKVSPRMTGWTWTDEDAGDVVIWCALWALAMMPPEPRDTPVDVRDDLARGRAPRPFVPGYIDPPWLGHRGWLCLPVTRGPMAPAQMQAAMATEAFAAVSHRGLPRRAVEALIRLGLSPESARVPELFASTLVAEGTVAIVRWTVSDDGNRSAPRRGAVGGELLRLGP